MAVPYVIKKKALPPNSGARAGKSLYYALPVSSGSLTLADLTQIIEKICTVHGADIRAVVYALLDVITQEISSGKIIKLGELGTFRLSFSSEGKETPEQVKPSSIKQSRILFMPGDALKKMLKQVSYVPVGGN
jgi:predicted histone-like DNA-binding protein